MGRTLVFMARILQDGRADHIRDIAVDERTAVVLDPSGVATVVGAGSVYFLQSTQNPKICKPGTPLTSRRHGAKLARGSAIQCAAMVEQRGHGLHPFCGGWDYSFNLGGRRDIHQ